jgi:hypothetical protein
MKHDFGGEKTSTSPAEEFKDGIPANDSEYSIDDLAKMYKLDQQEVGVAANDETFAVVDTEPASPEGMGESAEAFAAAKATFEGLQKQIDENNYDLHFLHEMDSAIRNIQVAEAVALNESYTPEKKSERAANAANFLNNLNSRVAAEIQRLNSGNVEDSPVTADVLDSEVLDGATNFGDLENTQEESEPVINEVEPQPKEETEASFVDLVKEDPLMKENQDTVEGSYLDLVKEDPLLQEDKKVESEVSPFDQDFSQEAAPVPVATAEVAPEIGGLPVNPAVEAAPVAPTVEVTPVAAAPEVVNEAALSKYQEKRAEWREYNKIFKKTESEYKQGLEDYYQNRSPLEKIRTGARSLMGLEPKFPPAVAELQARYSEAKKFYALEFSKVLALRGEAHTGNADYSLNRREVKRGMAQKFILKPAEQLLDLQAKTELTEKQNSVTTKIMGLMAKHKWGIRAGTVVLAGAIGFASGGASLALAAGGSKMVRMAAGTFGGALAGTAVNRGMKGYVETGEKRVGVAQEDARENFDLTNMEELEAELLSAQADKRTRESRRTAATVAAAVAGGVGAGIAASEIPVGVAAPAVSEVYREEGNNYPASNNNVNYSHEGNNYPTATEASEVIPPNEYVVEKGDNLWNIMKEQYANELKGLSPAEQNRVLNQLFENAKADETIRESIGLRNDNNLNLIYPGQTLELQSLGEELKDIIEQQKTENGIVTPTTETVEPPKINPLESGANLGNENIAGITNKPEIGNPYYTGTDESFAPRPFSVDGNYLNTPEYKDFALGSMGGQEQIDNSVRAAVDMVEGKQTIADMFSNKPRVFDYLKTLTVDNLNNLGKTPGAIENFAATNGVEENILREWMHNFDQLKRSNLPYSGTTQFGDLQTRAVIENHVNKL